MRVAAYTDYAYHRLGDTIYSDRAFSLFLARLADHVDRLVIIGRLDPSPGGSARYPIGDAEFVALPYYQALSQPLVALRAMPGAMRAFWATLGHVDCIWLLGPHPLAIPFALMASLRRKRVVLGVRQDFPAYIANRHARRPLLRAAGWMLEAGFRILARFLRVVVVGPDIALRYRGSRDLLEIAVSLVTEADLVAPQEAAARDYGPPLQLLSVGRLDEEKNPLLLADVLDALRADGSDWRLVVCGEGTMLEDLRDRIEHLGLGDVTDLKGYVPLRPGLLELYRSSHVLLHVSWTEGLPQVLIEACASGLPIVATDVGGVGALGSAAILVPPGDAGAAAQGATTIAEDPQVRQALVDAGNRYAAAHVLDAEVGRVAAFIRAV